MRKHQHRHNWKMRFTKWRYKNIDDNPYTNFGWDTKQYWVCIRGNKVKHTLTPTIMWGREDWKSPTYMKPTLILGSGVSNVYENAYTDSN